MLKERVELGGDMGVVIEGLYERGFSNCDREALLDVVGHIIAYLVDYRIVGEVISIRDCGMLVRYACVTEFGSLVSGVSSEMYMGLAARCMDYVRAYERR